MSMYEIEELRKSERMQSIYRKKFRASFGHDPVIDDRDLATCRKVIAKVKNQKELDFLVLGLFELDDDFLRSNGFKLQFLDNRINAIFARGGIERQKFHVGYLENGDKVYSVDPKILDDQPHLRKPARITDTTD